MGDAAESKERKGISALLSNQSYVSVGLVITLCISMLAVGRLTGRIQVQDEDREKKEKETEEKFTSIQAKILSDVTQSARETNLKIDALRQSMELRAASRDKEIEAINARLRGHDESIHELIIMVTKSQTGK